VQGVCHTVAHDLGKVIYAKLRDIGASLRVCSNRCYSGCMHGVMMEVIALQKEGKDEHINFEALEPVMKELCFENEEMKVYGPGECAHGIGHAIMFLSSYDIETTLETCNKFQDQHMKYFCADGAYMEYVGARDQGDAITKSLFYPCDQFKYPAPCMRSKMGNVVIRFYLSNKGISDIMNECEKLEGKYRVACFHGLGNSHSKIIALNKLNINQICSSEIKKEKIACIEGALHFMGKYYADKVERVCEDVDEDMKELCLLAGTQKLYSFEKDISLYLED